MALPKIATGARAIFRINGRIVAFGTNVGYRIAIPHGAVNVLGRYSVARHEPLGMDVSLTAGSMRFTGQGGTGNSPSSIASDMIFPRANDIINFDELQIEVIDRANDETIVAVDRARMTERSGTMGARDMLSEAWNFVGIIARDSDSGAQKEQSGPLGPPPNDEAAK
jgi:hypothetical protein